jgi:apolipoprotein N-acyltransferase
LRALLVQLNTPIEEKWDDRYLERTLEDYRELTRAYVESSHFDLVFWPETALPGRLTYPWVQEYLNREILRGGDFHLLMGIEEEEFNDAIIYNSIALMRGSTRNVETHRKLHLVPFGEYLPLRDSFPPFVWIAGGMVPRDFTAGSTHKPLRMEDPDLEIIPLVCFEDTIGRLARKFVRPASGAQLLVNVTNDGWFFESVQSLQHLANAKFRCVELRRPMARAANTGVSCFIDSLGSLEDHQAAPGTPSRERLLRVQDYVTGNTFVSGTLPATLEISKNPPYTVYARHGDAFSVGAGLLALLFAAAHGWRGRWRQARSGVTT